MIKLKNPHPGEILKYEFMDEIGMSQNTLSKATGVPLQHIYALINGSRVTY